MDCHSCASITDRQKSARPYVIPATERQAYEVSAYREGRLESKKEG
ncbi:MAG: hypothetical protein LBP40_02790 [Campylobacteraceae bacterium]|nr:hypothetical protein [Campylobacteraceae bacterium]